MSTKQLTTTICIIGAGPAGAATSIFLAKKKIPHLIIDAAIFPRDKVCGDGLDLKSIRLLNMIDPTIFQNEIIGNENFTACGGARLIHPSGKNRDFVFKRSAAKPHYYSFYVAKRMSFDNFLVNKIDAEFADFRQGVKVKSVEKTEAGWKVFAHDSEGEMVIDCKLLIGADGDHSVVLRHLGERKIDRQHYAGSVRQYWKNVADIHPENLLEFYFPTKYPLSYFWIFPLPNGQANVGYIMVSKYAADNNYSIRKIFTELIETDPILKERFKHATPAEEVAGWGLPLASLQRKAFGDGWLLVGDAASMISPVSGEGIGNSMWSGYVAAEFIERAVQQNRFDESMFSNYNREVYKSFQEEINRYNFFINKKPSLVNWVINTLVADNFLVQKIFQRSMKKWLHTAYEKRVSVTLD